MCLTLSAGECSTWASGQDELWVASRMLLAFSPASKVQVCKLHQQHVLQCFGTAHMMWIPSGQIFSLTAFVPVALHVLAACRSSLPDMRKC